ncbi:MAG: hypothetical protein CMO55_05570 [Verrucomicrobiales bacterium]|nr:hypothetical protein [Verrucomicrobiales bacterium]
MSIYSRDYMREKRPGGGVPGPGSWSPVTWLIVINATIFVIGLFMGNGGRALLNNYFALSLESLAQFKVWTILTHEFLHGSAAHLFFNMLGLFFLGRVLLQLIGKKYFLTVYLVGGMVGGVFQVLYNAIFGDAYCLGASGSVYATILAVGTLIPHQRFQIFPFPITITIRQFVIFLIIVTGISLVIDMVQPQSSDGIATMAHIGGMVFGWAYIKFWLPSANERMRQQVKPKKKSSLKEKFGIRIIRDAEVVDTKKPKREKKEKKQKPFVTQDVDAILDKINAEGFHSLTDEEKRVLEKSSQRLSKRIDRDN